MTPAPAVPTGVSCLVVTRPGRLDRLEDAVRCFAAQTHPSCELVVVHDGGRDFDADVRSMTGSLAPGSAVSVHRSRRRPLGSLRNVSVEVAGGDVVCQWDDDDLHHPRRVEVQLAHLVTGGDTGGEAAACLLTDQLHLFEADGELCWDDWTVERFPHSLIPGTLLAGRGALPRYPRRRRGEDTPVVTRIVGDGKRVRGLQDHGWLYVYVQHGTNAWDATHHRAISAWKHRGSRIGAGELALLAEELSSYPVAARRVVMAVGAERIELTIGAG
ncbi:MAG: glycosyltransferase family A protein [Acidimicrobiales bacterium]